jgi:YbbR domain-containing protein
MLRWFIRNVSTLLLSVAIAITIWIVALNEADPFQEKAFPQLIPVTLQNLPEGMIIVGDKPQGVEVRVRAPASVWARLTAEQIHITVDLADTATGTISAPLQSAIDYREARILSVAPSQVRLTLEKIVTRNIPVKVQMRGEPAVGYQAKLPQLSLRTATISGPSSIADTVSELLAPINLSGVKQTINDTLTLIPVNTTGQFVSGLKVEPATTGVIIAVEQLGGYRDVAVKALIEGQIATGHRITNIVVAPSVVTLFSSDPSLVAALPGVVETEKLNISKASDDIETRLGLKLPAGVSVIGSQSVLLQVSIAAIESSLTIQRDLEIRGLTSIFNAIASPSSVDVILSGPLPTLDTLDPGDVRVTLNLSNLTPGIHQIKPEVIALPQKVNVQTILPATIEVIITGPGTPTPSVRRTPTRVPIPTFIPFPTLTPTIETTTTVAPTLTPTPKP